MSSTLQIGPFVLQIQGLVIVMAAFFGYYNVTFRLKRIESIADSNKNQIIGTIEIAFILAIAIWKFSFILFEPVRVLAHPSSLLYFSGGERGVWLAIVTAVAFFYYRSKKEGNSIRLYMDLLAAAFLVGMGVYSIFALIGNMNKAWVYGSQVLIAAVLYYLHFHSGTEIAKLKNLNQALLWFSLGQVFVSFLNPLKQNVWLGFAQDQINFIILAAVCIGLDFLPADRTNKDA